MNTSHSFQSTPNLLCQSESSHPEMNKTPQNTDAQGLYKKNAEEYYLLSDEFSRIPFLLYRFWLILSFGTALTAEFFILYTVWELLDNRGFTQGIVFFAGYLIAGTGFLPLL